jgi:nitroreductase
MCAPLFAPEIVRPTLNLPTHWQPQALITIGYPAETREKTRHPVTNLTHFID